MRLYIGILLLIFVGNSNLWSTPKNYNMEMTKENLLILEELESYNKELLAIFAKNGLSMEEALNSTQIATFNQAVKMLSNVTEADGLVSPVFIPKGKFISFVKEWVVDFKSELEGIKDDDIAIDKKEIENYLKANIRNPKFPVSLTLWNEIEKELSKLGEKETPKSIRAAVSKGLDSFSKKMETDFPLSDEYKNNRAKYKAIKKKDLDDNIIKVNAFSKTLLPILSKAREKAEIEAKEIKEKAEVKVDDFKKAYEAWVKEQKEICTKIISTDQKTDSTNLMDKSKFLAILVKESKVWEAAQPELTGELLASISGNLKKDKLPIKEFVSAMSAAVTEINTPLTTIASNWFETPKFPEYYSLQTAIIANNTGLGEYDLMKEYLEWFATVGAAADSLTVSTGQQFIITKLVEGIKKEFKSKELEFFCTPFEEKLNKFKSKLNPTYCSLDELSYAWSESVYDVIMNSNTLNDSLGHLLKMGDETAIDSISNLLEATAGLSAIQRIFMDARRPPVKAKALANGENLGGDIGYIKFSDGTVLDNTIATKIVKVNGTPCVIPTGVTPNIVTNSKHGFEFEVTDFAPQSPILNGKEGVSTYFEYKIAFKRTRGSYTSGSGHSEGTGREDGTEESLTDIAIDHFGGSYTAGGSASATGGIVVAEGTVEVHSEYSVNYEYEGGTEKSKGSSVVISSSDENSTSQSNTLDNGNQEGFFLVKGLLYTHKIDKKGGTVEVVLSKNANPNKRNGLVIYCPKGQLVKTLRWSKD
jgi:hypothetical protein